MTLPLLGTRYIPARTVIDDRGTGYSGRKAQWDLGIEADVVFLRQDGWTLGAQKELELVAYEMWKDEWAYFTRKPFKRWVPIQKYGGSR